MALHPRFDFYGMSVYNCCSDSSYFRIGLFYISNERKPLKKGGIKNRIDTFTINLYTRFFKAFIRLFLIRKKTHW